MDQNGRPAGEEELILALAAGATRAGGRRRRTNRPPPAGGRRFSTVSQAPDRMFDAARGRLASKAAETSSR
jgi:hypothetical protein